MYLLICLKEIRKDKPETNQLVINEESVGEGWKDGKIETEQQG